MTKQTFRNKKRILIVYGLLNSKSIFLKKLQALNALKQYTLIEDINDASKLKEFDSEEVVVATSNRLIDKELFDLIICLNSFDDDAIEYVLEQKDVYLGVLPINEEIIIRKRRKKWMG